MYLLYPLIRLIHQLLHHSFHLLITHITYTYSNLLLLLTIFLLLLLTIFLLFLLTIFLLYLLTIFLLYLLTIFLLYLYLHTSFLLLTFIPNPLNPFIAVHLVSSNRLSISHFIDPLVLSNSDILVPFLYTTAKYWQLTRYRKLHLTLVVGNQFDLHTIIS